jgi:tRNA 2-selenouridine synthase
LEGNTLAIRKRLGGLKTQEILQTIVQAFEAQDSATARELHGKWIEMLLVHYYDPAYQGAFERNRARPILFRGNEEECRQWILNRSV